MNRGYEEMFRTYGTFRGKIREGMNKGKSMKWIT